MSLLPHTRLYSKKSVCKKLYNFGRLTKVVIDLNYGQLHPWCNRNLLSDIFFTKFHYSGHSIVKLLDFVEDFSQHNTP